MDQYLTFALPKGKLSGKTLELLHTIGLPLDGVETEGRQLVFTFPEEELRYIICRPTDIPTYVEYGAADLGIVGKDTIEEAGADVFELVDLKFGYCRFVVAALREKWEQAGSLEELLAMGHRRVATKFPRVAANFFRNQGLQVEIIKLHGNIELAPQVGLADLIVDIVSTGRTLRENDLVEVAPIFPATARLIANRVSYRLKHRQLAEMAAKMRAAVEKQETGTVR
ncbi:MAG: phosphoribosyltransferase [Clostridia bacterium]|nr:phosphoribosyltransferase [Clostridia bacterium]